MIGGMATRSLNLEQGQGIKLCEFDEIPDNKVFIENWHRNLNALDFTIEKEQTIEDEVNSVLR